MARFPSCTRFAESFAIFLTRKIFEIVAVHHTCFGHSFAQPEGNFNRNMADRRGDFGGYEFTEERISVIAAQQQNGAPPGRFGQFRPPDFILFHGFHSSALDRSSASSAESGWRRYASRMA